MVVMRRGFSFATMVSFVEWVVAFCRIIATFCVIYLVLEMMEWICNQVKDKLGPTDPITQQLEKKNQ
jgi:hypothetical protein